jgi:hypothetical protein
MIATLDTFREMLEDASMLTHPHRLSAMERFLAALEG